MERTTPLPPSPPTTRNNQRSHPHDEGDNQVEEGGDMENDEGSSSLRTHLMKAQILDTQLETEEETGMAELLTEDQDNNQVTFSSKGIDYCHHTYMYLLLFPILHHLLFDDQIDGTAVLNEMDDAIIRLRKWQLDREINKLEVQMEMQQAWEVREAKHVETAAKISTNALDTEGEYKQRRSASKKSVKSNLHASLRTFTP